MRVYRLDLTPKAKTVSEAPRPMSAPPDKPSIAVFIAYLFVGGVGKANAARLGDAFDSCCNIDAVSKNVLALEFAMWQGCLRSLKEIHKPRLVHYGAYESGFLKLMRSRWKPADEDAAFVDQLIDTSINLVSSIYGKIYFPVV